MKLVMSHPTGNSNVRAVISALDRAGMLTEFNTTLAIKSGSKWLNFLPKSMSEQLTRRSFPSFAGDLNGNLFPEIARLMLPKLGIQSLVVPENAWASIDTVYKNLDRKVSKRIEGLVKKQAINAVYGYEDGALESFKQAKKLGLTCIYDLPIAYWETCRKLLKEEAERLPDWAETLGGGIQDSEQKLMRKMEELHLADIVIVPSTFVLDSIPDWAKEKKVVQTPFGTPLRADFLMKKQRKIDRKLRLLFVGSMSQRKGLADLFEAVKILDRQDLELVVMGSPMVSMEFYKQKLPQAVFLSTRSHRQVLELMNSCDVFCLPSIVEGRALVMQEAMSQGLPILITPNTGGQDLVIDGTTGFTVPIRSPESIANKITWFLENRRDVSEMGYQALKHAEKYTWEAYGDKIVSALSSL